MRLIFIATLRFWSGVLLIALSGFLFNSVFAFSNSSECKNNLKGLVVPPLKHVVISKSTILAELEDSNNDVYSARLYVPADSPENLNKQVSIGWVNLDVNSMKVYDVSNDPDSKIELTVDQSLYKKYVARCVKDTARDRAHE